MTFSLILIDYTADRLFYLRKLCIFNDNANVNSIVNSIVNANDCVIVNGPTEGAPEGKRDLEPDLLTNFSNFLYPE